MRWEEKRAKRREQRAERGEKASAALRTRQLRRFTNRFALLLAIVTFTFGIGVYCWMLRKSLQGVSPRQQYQSAAVEVEVQKTGGGNHDNKNNRTAEKKEKDGSCLLYTSPSPRDLSTYRMPSSA